MLPSPKVSEHAIVCNYFGATSISCKYKVKVAVSNEKLPQCQTIFKMAAVRNLGFLKV